MRAGLINPAGIASHASLGGRITNLCPEAVRIFTADAPSPLAEAAVAGLSQKAPVIGETRASAHAGLGHGVADLAVGAVAVGAAEAASPLAITVLAKLALILEGALVVGLAEAAALAGPVETERSSRTIARVQTSPSPVLTDAF